MDISAIITSISRRGTQNGAAQQCGLVRRSGEDAPVMKIVP